MATARNTLSVAIKLDGTAQAKKDLEDVGKAGEKAFASLAKAADKIAPGLGSQFQAALRGLRSGFLLAQRDVARFSQSFSSLTLAVNAVGNSILGSVKKISLLTASITGAATAVGFFFKRSADNAEHITGQAEALGISAQAYQTFQAAVTDAGLSQEQFDQILSKFSVTAADGAAGAGDLAKAFRQVEITGADGVKRMITVHGTSDSLAKSLVDTTKAFRQLEIVAEDGTKKFITIMGTSDKLAKSVAGLVGGGEKGLVTFAKNIEALKTSQERLNAVIDAGFAKKAAPAVVRAMLAIARDADPAARALNKVLEPLDNVQLGGLLQIDAGFDHLFLNLSRIKDSIASIFGPAVGELLNGLAAAIFDNQKAIRAFADEVAKGAIVVVRDLLALLRGDDAAVQNKGLIAFRDTVIGIGKTIKSVVVDVIIPGFQKLGPILDGIATKVNSFFGTSFTGQGLAVAAVILQITGAFSLLLSLFSLGAAALQVLGGGINLLLVALRPLAFALGFVGAALASLLGLPAAVGVAIVAAIAIATAATIVYWDDIKAGAADAWAFATEQVTTYVNAVGQFLGQGGGLDQAWESIKKGAADAWQFATQQAQQFVADLQAILANPGDLLGNLKAAFSALFSDILGSARSFASSLVSTLSSAIDSIISAVQRAIAAFQQLFSASRSSSSSSSVSGFKATALSRAGGGIIRGPGTGTSDSILTWLSDGEFVIKASAVRRWGVSMLEALNRGGSFITGARGFANGGLAGALAGGLSVDLPRLSFGPLDERSSPVAPLQPVTFVLDGQKVPGFSAIPGAVDELMRASAQKRVRSNGRKPGWYGGTV